MTQATSREDVIQQDVKDLHRLGYAQELFRSMGGFSNFAISFSIISILTGAVILYDYGLAWAGTAASLIGWPLITIFVLCIAASMAEVASAYPTAGGLYYWASRMKNKNWGWWTAWLNLIGQFAIVAGINYAAALFLNATIITPLTGGAYSNTTVFFGDPAFGAEGPALERRARHHGRAAGRRAGPQHRGRQGRRAAEPDQRLVAHLLRHRHRRVAVRPRHAVDHPGRGADPVRHPTGGHRRGVGQHLPGRQREPVVQLPVRPGRRRTRCSWPSSSACCRRTGPIPATTHPRTSPRRPSAPGGRAPGASSCRWRCRQWSATSSCWPSRCTCRI